MKPRTARRSANHLHIDLARQGGARACSLPLRRGPFSARRRPCRRLCACGRCLPRLPLHPCAPLLRSSARCMNSTMTLLIRAAELGCFARQPTEPSSHKHSTNLRNFVYRSVLLSSSSSCAKRDVSSTASSQRNTSCAPGKAGLQEPGGVGARAGGSSERSLAHGATLHSQPLSTGQAPHKPTRSWREPEDTLQPPKPVEQAKRCHDQVATCSARSVSCLRCCRKRSSSSAALSGANSFSSSASCGGARDTGRLQKALLHGACIGSLQGLPALATQHDHGALLAQGRAEMSAPNNAVAPISTASPAGAPAGAPAFAAPPFCFSPIASLLAVAGPGLPNAS